MQRKLPNNIVDLIQKYDRQDLSVAEISRRTDVPYSTVWGYTAAKKKGFASRTEYNEHLAKQRGFASRIEYDKHLAKQRGFASYGAYQEDLAKKKGFASRTEYNEHLAKQRGFASRIEYDKHLAKQRGFASYGAYQEDLAKKKGFASYGAYQGDLAKQRQQKLVNQELSDLIKTRLAEIGRTQKWLAERLGITKGTVSRYASGRITPRKNLQSRLFEALGLPHQTLDDLVE